MSAFLSMHVNPVELQFGDGGVLILRARIDIDNLESQAPLSKESFSYMRMFWMGNHSSYT